MIATSTKEAPVPAIAVIVATHRRPDAIAVLMNALARQTLPKQAYVVSVMVDGRDESEPEYRMVLEDAQHRLGVPLCYAFQDNAGPAAARHRAIAATSARWICISDDDMDLARDFLKAHLEALECGGERTVVIGAVVPENNWQNQPLYEATRTYSMLALHDGLWRGARRAQGSALVTQNVSLARSAYDRVGGFDQTLRLGEDTELGWRLERDGERFVFAPEARAVHLSRVGSYDTWLRRQFQYGRNAVYIYRKLGCDSRAHPLRNLVNGNRLKRAAVQMTCWSDTFGGIGIAVLRRSGNVLQRLGAMRLAIATHQGIMAIAFHLGVKDALGSWTAVRGEKRTFLAARDRPLDAT